MNKETISLGATVGFLGIGFYEVSQKEPNEMIPLAMIALATLSTAAHILFFCEKKALAGSI